VRGLLEFLNYHPFFEASTWRTLVQQPCEDRDPRGLLSIRGLLRGVMLRRTRVDVADELDLPPCTSEDRWVKLSPVEQLVYQQAKKDFLQAAFQLSQTTNAVSAQPYCMSHGSILLFCVL
jgi:E3 ubiquitin-protein ligase SHPRH